MQKTLSVVNLTAIRQNARRIKSILNKKKFYAVVKADAYGHGAEEVSRCIEDVVDGFCVAIIDEGVALRIAGVQKPVLVFAPPQDKYDVERCRIYNLTVTVNSTTCARLCKDLDCHIKVNTGMNRLGCSIGDLPDILGILPKNSVKGVYSHLYAPQSNAASMRQLSLFYQAKRIVKAENARAIAHISASGGILRGNRYLLDGARAGLLLYGYAPEGFSSEGFTPALKVYAKKIQRTKFIGGGIGYSFADKNYKRVSCYRLGYADGFSRVLPLGEKTLCMDAFVSEENQKLLCVMDNADEYAKKLGTISYEVLVNCTHRSQRVYER